MTRLQRWLAATMSVVFAAAALMVGAPARANEEGRRNTTIGLGALSGLLFTLGGSKIPAFAALGATAYAYRRYEDSIHARHRRERYARLHRRHHYYRRHHAYSRR